MSDASPLHVGILGATGAVGRALVQLLDEGELPVASLRLLASEHSAGAELDYAGETLRVAPVAQGSFDGLDLVFMAAGAAAACAWAPKATAAGAAVVDLSAAFRADPSVPLIVPELNGAALRRGSVPLAASPGPGAVQLALVLSALRAAAGLEEVAVASLQPAATAGQRGVEGLEDELRAMLAFQEPDPPTALPHRLAFNLIPQVGVVGDDGSTEDELRLASEVRRVLGDERLRLRVTAVRLPLFHGHTQLLSLRTGRPLSAAEAREALRAAPGVKLLDAPQEGVYPMPMLAVADDAVLAGRVRKDPTRENGLELVVVGDDLRRGGALNAVGIARLLR